MSRLFPVIVVLIFLIRRLYQPATPLPPTASADPFSGLTDVFVGVSHDLIVAAVLAGLLFAGLFAIKVLFENWMGR